MNSSDTSCRLERGVASPLDISELHAGVQEEDNDCETSSRAGAVGAAPGACDPGFRPKVPTPMARAAVMS
jgi:hypothetical protein